MSRSCDLLWPLHRCDRCDLLTSWPWTYTALRVFCIETLYKISVKSNNPRVSYGRISTFCRCNFKGGHFYETVLRGAWIQLRQTRQEHRAIIAVSEFRYIAAFSNAGGSKLSDVKNEAKFRTLWPLWKLGRDGLDCWINQCSFTYNRTSGIQFMAVFYAASESRVLIKKKVHHQRWLSLSTCYVGRPKILTRLDSSHVHVNVLSHTQTPFLSVESCHLRLFPGESHSSQIFLDYTSPVCPWPTASPLETCDLAV